MFCGTPWDARKSVATFLSLGPGGRVICAFCLTHPIYMILTFYAGPTIASKSSVFVAVHLVCNNLELD